MIYPWQNIQWQQLWQTRQQHRLPHALLLMGLPGVGKKQFAQAFAHSILCVKPDAEGKPCGVCRTCYLVQAQSHPDLRMIEPEKEGQMINVDQVREVISFVNETAMQGGFRVIIIHPAAAMNMHAANALLKTLEEPTPNTLFMLIGEQHLRLPATIASRCQKIIFQKPAHDVALAWLQQTIPSPQADLLLNLAQGAPLKALQLNEDGTLKLREELYQGLYLLSEKKADPLQLAGQWQEENMVTIFNLLQSWLRDLLSFKLSSGQTDAINADYQKQFAELDGKISQTHLVHFIDHVQQLYAKLLRSINFNRQLLLEDIFIQWVKYGPG